MSLMLGQDLMLHSLEGIQGDIYLGSFVNLDHEFYEQRTLCKYAEIDT